MYHQLFSPGEEANHFLSILQEQVQDKVRNKRVAAYSLAISKIIRRGLKWCNH